MPTEPSLDFTNDQAVRQAVRRRVEGSFAARIESQVRAATRQQWIEQPTLAAGNGLVKPLGAAAGVRPRGNSTTGGVQAGDPVPSTQGIIGGLPTASQGGQERYKELSTILGKVAFERGLQVRDTPVDDEDDPALARYPYDLHWDDVAMTLHYWSPSTTAEEGEWVPLPLGSGVPSNVEAPTAYSLEGKFDGELYWSTKHKTLWRWAASTTPPPAGQWVALLQQASGNGTPAATGVTGYLAGATYYDTAATKTYFWSGSAWIEAGGGGAAQSCFGRVDASESSTLGRNTLPTTQIAWADWAGMTVNGTTLVLPAAGRYRVSLQCITTYISAASNTSAQNGFELDVRNNVNAYQNIYMATVTKTNDNVSSLYASDHFAQWIFSIATPGTARVDWVLLNTSGSWGNVVLEGWIHLERLL